MERTKTNFMQDKCKALSIQEQLFFLFFNFVTTRRLLEIGKWHSSCLKCRRKSDLYKMFFFKQKIFLESIVSRPTFRPTFIQNPGSPVTPSFGTRCIFIGSTKQKYLNFSSLVFHEAEGKLCPKSQQSFGCPESASSPLPCLFFVVTPHSTPRQRLKSLKKLREKGYKLKNVFFHIKALSSVAPHWIPSRKAVTRLAVAYLNLRPGICCCTFWIFYRYISEN